MKRLLILTLIIPSLGFSSWIKPFKATGKHVSKHKVMYSLAMEAGYLGVQILKAKTTTINANSITIFRPGQPTVGAPK